MKGARWSVAALYVSTIYLTVPYTTRVWLAVSGRSHLSPATLSLIILSVTGGLLLVTLIRGSGLDLRVIGGVLLLCLVYGYLLRTAFVEPIERIHLIEYGVLPWLFWWSMGSRVTVQTLAMVWVVSADVGVFDELIQHFTPGRYGELRDVVINWESSTLGMALMALAVRRPRP